MKFNMKDQRNLKEEVLNDVTPENNAPEVDEKPRGASERGVGPIRAA